VRAERRLRRFLGLPDVLRTNDRTRAVVEDIFLYAYEDVGPDGDGAAEVSWEQSRRVSSRLQEFLSPAPGDQLMPWLHANLLDEAWRDRGAIRALVGDCLRSL
jgi:hypothetical protein